MWNEGPDRVVFDKVKVLTGAARRRGVPVFYFYNHLNRASPTFPPRSSARGST